METYVRVFEATASALERKGELATAQKCKLFLRGLPASYQGKVAEVGGLLDDDEDKKLDYNKMVKEVKRKARIHKVINEVNDPADVKSLVEKVGAHPTIGPKEESVRGVITNPVEMPAKPATVEAPKVDELADALAKLTIGAARLQPEEKARLVALVKSLGYTNPIGPLDPALSRNNRPMGGDYSERAPGEDRYQYLRRMRRCLFCEKPGHRTDTCESRLELLQKGLVHTTLGSQALRLGPSGSNNPPILYTDNGTSRYQQTLDAIKASQKESELANASSQGLSVGSARVEPLTDDDTDVEYDEGGVDEAALFGVTAARNDKARKPSGTGQDGVIGARIEKERNLPAAKGRRYGNYTVPVPGQPVVGVDEPTVESQETAQGDEVMEVDPAGPPAPVSKKVRFNTQQSSPQKLVKAVQGKDSAGKLAQALLKMEVFPDYTVEDALGLAEVRRIVFANKRWDVDESDGHISLVPQQPKVKEASVSLVADSAILEEDDDKGDIDGLAQIAIQTEVVGQDCLAVLDSGATVSVMSRRMMEELGLSARKVRKQARCPIRIGTVRAFTGILVVETIDPKYDLLLGRPLQRELRCQTWFDSDMQTWVRFFDPVDGHAVTVPDVNADSNLK